MLPRREATVELPMTPASRSTALAAAMILAASVTTCAAAAPYPDRPIRILAGEAGAQSDTMARVLAPALSATLGQSVVVENRSGAGGTIAALRTVQSRPDGYTLLLGGVNNVVLGPLVRRELAYAPARDLVPLGGVGRAPYGVAVARHIHVADLGELVAYARARPGELAFGSSGIGSSSHAALALLAARAGLSLLHVPYRGSPVALNDLVAGRIDIFACDLSLLLPFAKTGAVRIIAMAGTRRTPAAPSVPTVAEQGFPGYAVDPWYALYAPSGTPKPVIDALSRALAGALRDPAVSQEIASQGYEPLPLTADEVRALAQADTLRFESVLEDASVPDGPGERPSTR
ncbi:MAG TPA: tripartite tricarboxylate transporter substrate binding protein [Casimicrobiaceae bacterium]|nr:tripartite tricarboxylate transporter substrate binding protein [Casimicrobiaceae bacterium]